MLRTHYQYQNTIIIIGIVAVDINTHNEWHMTVKCTDGTYMAVQLVKFKMKFVFVLLVAVIPCSLSIGDRCDNG